MSDDRLRRRLALIQIHLRQLALMLAACARRARQAVRFAWIAWRFNECHALLVSYEPGAIVFPDETSHAEISDFMAAITARDEVDDA